MLGRGLVSLAAVTAILVVGPSAASGQENPVLDPESLTPVIPYSVGEQLAARGEDVDDLKQRHPWVPNNAPLPLNFNYVQGSYRRSNGSSMIIWCALDVAAEHPYWYQENMLRTWVGGGARCNERLDENYGGGMTGTVRAFSWPGGSQLASASLGTQHEVPPGHGFGWQAYGIAAFDRSAMNSNQQVKLEARLELPVIPGATNVGWNSYRGCTRESNLRVIHCELWSPPFQTVPYPCPSGKVGVQPPTCVPPPSLCPSGQYGIQPNCFTLPSRPECTGPILPDDSPDTHCPEDEDLPGRWGPEDGPYLEPEALREQIEEDTGRLPGEPLPAATAGKGNPNNNDDPHFLAEATQIHNANDKHIGAYWCNSGYRVRRRWCYTARETAGKGTTNGGAQKLRSTTARAVYVCFQYVDGYPVGSNVPPRKKYETCGTNVAKTGFVRPKNAQNGGWFGECEHFHVKRQWVFCSYEYGKPQ